MDYIFEIVDKSGRKIHLSPNMWAHVTIEHPYMTNYPEEIKETIRNPDKITDYGLDEDIKYYYKYFKHRKSQNKYLLVIVKYLNSTGFMISSYFVRYIK